MKTKTRAKPMWLAALLAGLLFAGAEVAQAQTIYGSGNDGTNLLAINTSTGGTTVIGSFGYGASYGTAFGPDGTLYTLVDSYNSGRLATVNLSTGAATPVGPATGIADLMAMDFAPDGTLYAGSWATNSLYKINPSTGVATLVGTSLAGVMDFAFNPAGVLYATDSTSLYTINLLTGAATLVAALSGTDGQNMGIAFDAAGNLFGTSYNTTNSQLWSINSSTGVATLVGYTGIPYLHGGDILYAVPETSTWATFAGICSLVFVFIRKRRTGLPVRSDQG